MADLVPSIFNKADFFGKLLPGYLALVSYLFLFTPETILGVGQGGLSSEVFAVIVFLVGGPAIGLALQQAHRKAFTFYYLARGALDEEERRERAQQVMEYGRLRIACTQEEKLELDRAESDYDFSVSTGLILLVLALLGLMATMDARLVALLMGGAAFFFIGGWVEWRENYVPVAEALIAKHP